MTLSKTKSKYNGLVEVRLSGYAPGYQITVRWPGGAVLAQTRADAFGNAVTFFRTPPVPLGDYVIRATDQAGHSAVAELRVIPRIIAAERSGPAGTETRIDFYGYEPGHSVEVRWFEGQSFAMLASVTIDANGQATTQIAVPAGASLGRHTIRGKVVGIGRSVTTTFDVTAGAAAAGNPTSTTTPTITPVATPRLTVTPEATQTPTVTATPTATWEPTLLPTDEPTATEMATAEPTPTEPVVAAPTEVASIPDSYRVVQTSRSPSTASGTDAVDANPATVWGTTDGEEAGQTATLVLELEGDLPIGEVRLLPGPAGLIGTPTIETSDDGEAWSFYAEPDPAVVDENGWIRVSAAPEVIGPVSGRFVRVVFENPGESPTLGGLAEIVVMPLAGLP